MIKLSWKSFKKYHDRLTNRSYYHYYEGWFLFGFIPLYIIRTRVYLM